MLKKMKTFLSENFFVLLGILLGLCISTFLSNSFETQCNPSPMPQWIRNETVQEVTNANKLHPKVNLPKKVEGAAKKPKPIRPRYYSTELGIKEKLFVGIFTSEEKINNQTIHINNTIGHLVNKIKYFITAQYKLKSKFNLTGLVGFTDARHKFRPFQIVKYVGDSFIQDYDFFFFAQDHTFINIHRLKDVVNKISVGKDVYMGTRVRDSSYCDLSAGILVSNSVLKAMRTHLDWCVMNTVSDDHSENIGRCIYYSIALTCQESVQEEKYTSLKLKHFELEKHLLNLIKNEEFNNAITVFPILQKNDFYILNAYFLKQRLANIRKEIETISATLTDTWPPGHRIGAKPVTRYDLPRQFYFNMSHMFFPDDFVNVKPHTKSDLLDIENVIEEVRASVAVNHSKELLYRRLVNGYRSFDLSRGMDYTLDLGFRDLTTGLEVIKRFEVCKPLGSVEVIPVPYVTENSRVNIILPIQETEISSAISFLNDYASSIMDRKEKTFLMVVLLYQFGSESKGNSDVFKSVKQLATKISNQYKNEDYKIAWLSIRLPESSPAVSYANLKALNFAIVDLALKKIGLESLMLVLDVYSKITIEFLNRVRMNTIKNFQIFSPIPFRQYDSKVTQINTFDLNKNTGHFDDEEYKYISFYGRDYVETRKRYKHIVPLIRTDVDIANIMDDQHKNIGNIFEMFIKYNDDLHCMRATDMSFKILHQNLDEAGENLFFGTNVQLAKMLLTKQDEINELS